MYGLYAGDYFAGEIYSPQNPVTSPVGFYAQLGRNWSICENP